jgi:hypothetical protein
MRSEISQGGKIAYARLAQYAGKNGEAWPKRETLAAEIGIKARQCDRYISELEKHRLIEVERPGLTKSNRYRFLYHKWMSTLDSTHMSTQDSTDMSTQNLPYASTHTERESAEENYKVIRQDSDSLDRIIQSSSIAKRKLTPPDPATLAGFEQFYQAYPCHVGKADALKAWINIAPSPELIDEVMAAVERYAETLKGTDPKYIKHPASWLRGQRWEDEQLMVNDESYQKPKIKDLGDGLVEVDGRRMDRETYERRHG